MQKIRKSEDRGSANHGWLNAKHTFSFGSYQDPHHKHFGPLLVINQDIISAGAGFPDHPHENMEIITYITKGELSHKDSSGGGSTIYPGKVQRMSAGTGIVHSEFNNSGRDTELLQIWIIPEQKNLTPTYEEQEFCLEEAENTLQLLVSQEGKDSLYIHRDMKIFRSFLNSSRKLLYKPLKKSQWLQLISGILEVNGSRLNAGDAIGLQDEGDLSISASEKAHFLLFDMN